jgi:nickel superoxide dismutase
MSGALAQLRLLLYIIVSEPLFTERRFPIMRLSHAFAVLNRLLPAQEASAHCDIPCGIYDPHLAQLAALTAVRMNQLIQDLKPPTPETSKEERDKYVHALERYTTVKEEHAELIKKEVRIIWGDYFRPEHVDKYPELHHIVWNIMKLGSKARQEVNMQAAQDLLADVQRFADIFWATKGASTQRQPSRQTVGGEIVYPAG